jgi:deoxyribodipyrimidine photolyase-related protein
MSLYILPNQLFDYALLPKSVSSIVIWEHPSFFTKYNFNKKKLLLHRASMRYYFDHIPKHISATYIEFHESHSKPEKCLFFDPINSIRSFTVRAKMIESPNFLLTKDIYSDIYDNKKSKKISFTRYFYPRCKTYLDFLIDTKSTDKDNRAPFNKKIAVLPLPSFTHTHYINEAIQYIQMHFKHNYGNTEHFAYPINRVHARDWLDHFIQNNITHFGTYQDAFNSSHDNMFHSMLSSSLNIGIINPSDVLDALKNTKKRVPINSLEGYFRQLCWREFQRYCYIYYKDTLSKSSLFNFTNKMDKRWYNATTNILPIDNCIRKAFDTAYLHHIERLMIVGNFMVLCEIKPSYGHKWFMEFAIDSYEWVMLQNVYDMVFFNANGLTSYKPYITSSKYLTKMSDYSTADEWTDIWNTKYRNFLKKHAVKLQKYKYHFPIIKKYLKKNSF